MPFDCYYGSSAGVDVLYPSQIMNPHNFPAPEWHTTPLSHSPLIPLRPQEYDQQYAVPHRPPPIQVSTIPNQMVPFSRPKSSPSTFGANVEDLLFKENPYHLKSDEYAPAMFSLSPQPLGSLRVLSPYSTKAPSPYYPAEYPASNASTSPRPCPVPIAPDPVGLRQMTALKRMRDEEESSEFGQRKRKRAPSQSGPVELNEEEQLLLKLKEEENLPWKDIAVRFQHDLGKSYQVPALQMRFKRLRERMRAWTETDVQALEQAYDYWEKFQFDIIAAKMLDFGASERWPAKYCARKWDEIHPGRGPYPTHSTFLRDPWDTASPVESSISHNHSPRPL